jgi:hypothetical protein
VLGGDWGVEDGKRTELSDIIVIWSYLSIRILIYVEVGDIRDFGGGLKQF